MEKKFKVNLPEEQPAEPVFVGQARRWLTMRWFLDLLVARGGYVRTEEEVRRGRKAVNARRAKNKVARASRRANRP